jgi:hypothetical protein
MVTTTAANRMLVDGCIFDQGGADAGPNSALDLVGAEDAEIRNCYFHGNFAHGCIQCLGTLSARIWIHDCKFWTRNITDLAIKDIVTSSTGRIGPNLQIMLTDNAANLAQAVTGGTFHMIDPVYVVNLVNEKAALSTWTATTNA